MEQRISILKVHATDMHRAGRVLVRDAPDGSAAAQQADNKKELLSYDELLESLAGKCDGFSGASLAGVARAAASHALERAVEDFSQHYTEGRSLLHDCVVTIGDFDSAVADVLESRGGSDWSEDEREEGEEGEEDSAPTQDSSQSEF